MNEAREPRDIALRLDSLQRQIDDLKRTISGNRDDRLKALADKLEAAEKRLKERDEAPVPQSLQDIIDPSLSPREQHDKLIARYRDAKNLEEMARANGDKSEMMIQLTKAQRLESGIAWNRARLTEQV